MSITSTPTIGLIEKYLELVTSRHETIVSNMANVDTPGFHTRDVDFRTEMQRAINMGQDAGQMRPVAKNVVGLLERPDGNNVNIYREGMLLAETQMQFQIGVQLVKSEFHRLMSAINEGK